MNPADNTPLPRDSGTAQVVALPAVVGCPSCHRLYAEICQLQLERDAWRELARVRDDLLGLLVDRSVKILPSSGHPVYRRLNAALAAVAALGKEQALMTEESRIPDLVAEVEKGRAFKAFVHAYLDAHGVPHGDPENQHQREGCRIGARLDLLLAQRDNARQAALLEAAAALVTIRDLAIEAQHFAVAKAQPKLHGIVLLAEGLLALAQKLPPAGGA